MARSNRPTENTYVVSCQKFCDIDPQAQAVSGKRFQQRAGAKRSKASVFDSDCFRNKKTDLVWSCCSRSSTFIKAAVNGRVKPNHKLDHKEPSLLARKYRARGSILEPSAMIRNGLGTSSNGQSNKSNWWFSLSRNKKIKSKPFNDRSYEFQIL